MRKESVIIVLLLILLTVNQSTRNSTTDALYVHLISTLFTNIKFLSKVCPPKCSVFVFILIQLCYHKFILLPIIATLSIQLDLVGTEQTRHH